MQTMRPAGETIQLAYLILAHKLPAQVLRLVRTLASFSTGPIIVHADRKNKRVLRELLEARDLPPQIQIISTVDVHWGHISTIDALVDGLELILDKYPQATHIKHLSGQDYPARPLAQLHALLGSHPATSFLEFHRVPNPVWSAGGETRGGLNRVIHPHLRLGSRMVRLPLTMRPPEFPLYGGSALWCLYREHARYVVQRVPELRRLFRWTSSADELFFQTALLNSPFAEHVINNGMTYVKWEPSEPHPKTLRREDLANIHDSGCWFARKFANDVDAGILDDLDRYIGLERP